MTVQAAETSVRTPIVVEAPIVRAFSVFTDEIGSWWNPEHHILQADLAEVVFEPREGGHVYDRGVDGSECRCGVLSELEPGRSVPRTWAWRFRGREAS
jgi:hypothetical protein